MCTYNGEKYLREQIDSILAQKGVEVALKVADDCSTDGTVSILEEYRTAHPNVDYTVNQENKRFTYNFIDLFFSADGTDYDYFAFSDQDDFWQEEKLLSAIEQMERMPQNERGTLYCSNLIVTDGNLNPRGMQEGKRILKANKKTFPYENIATGCTCVFDAKFFRHCKKYYPQNIHLHDYWFFLIAAYTAQYVYDLDGHILYRQHGGNQIGSNQKLFTKRNVKGFRKYQGAQSSLARELLNGYGEEMSEKDKKRFLRVRDYKKKFSLWLCLLFGARCHTLKKTFALKVKVLTHKL